jgi:hypothetical protein
MGPTFSSASPWPSPSEPASSSAELEREYRRLIACYPRSFRNENAEEILTVLLATARDGQRRPGLAESADLLRGAARMWLGLSRSPRTVLYAVRLMYLGAASSLGVLITLVLTSGGLPATVRAAIIRQDPRVSPAILGRALWEARGAVTVGLVLVPITIVAWLFLAYAAGRGSAWARVASVLAFAFATMSFGVKLSIGTAAYDPTLMIAFGVEWVIGLAAVTLLMCKPSWPYFEQRTAVAAEY